LESNDWGTHDETALSRDASFRQKAQFGATMLEAHPEGS